MAEHQAEPTTGGQAPQGPDEPEQEPSVSDPAEVIRLANMLQALVVEVRDLELDDAGRRRLYDVQHRAVDGLKALISDELEEELEQLGLPIEDPDASAQELRLAQSQLVGWLNGLFQGIQATLMAQQRGSAQQLEQLRRQSQSAELPQGHPGGAYL